MRGRVFPLAGGLLCEGVPFPENAVCVTLDGMVFFGCFQPFFGPGAVLDILLYAEEKTSEFFRRDRGGTGTGEGIEYHIPCI